ncbi:MAG TPA: cellulase family glycosylhydrolase [Actinomycetota bacterium]
MRTGAVIVFACALSMLASVCSAANGQQSTGAIAPRLAGPLHTDGTRILDARGHAVRFLGMELTNLGPGEGKPSSQTGLGCTGWSVPSSAALDNIQAWGFNVVRLAVAWANLEPKPPVRVGTVQFHFWNQQYLQALDQVVWGLTSRGIGVILEMSQDHWSPAFDRYPGSPCPGRGLPAWLYQMNSTNTETKARVDFFRDVNHVQEGLQSAWQFLAGRYSANPLVIGADMFNEPYVSVTKMSRADMHLGDLYQKIGSTIRAQAPDMLLLFQNSQYVRKTKDFALQYPPAFANTVYEFHLYRHDWNSGQGVFRAQEGLAHRWQVPLLMGEFNAFNYASNTKSAASDWRSGTNQLLAYARQQDVGWVFFAYSGGNSLVTPGTNNPKPKLLPTLQDGF